MSDIHFMMQGKGGIGKSYVAFLMGQYLKHKNRQALLLDTDPSNSTFSLVKTLDVQCFAITKGNNLDQRQFDALIELIANSAKPDGANDDIVIDCGASGFIDLRAYLIATQAIAMLHDMGHRVILHCPVVGGSDLNETWGGFLKLSKDLPDAYLLIWLNHHLHGEVEYQGKSIRETNTLKRLAERVLGVVDLPERNERLDKVDMRDLMSSHLTFEEAIASAQFTMMSRQRLKLIWQQTIEDLDATQLIDDSNQESA